MGGVQVEILEVHQLSLVSTQEKRCRLELFGDDNGSKTSED